jgi:hypothetical protein
MTNALPGSGKTMSAALIMLALAVLGSYFGPSWIDRSGMSVLAAIIRIVFVIAAVGALIVAASCATARYRARRSVDGQEDLFLALNRSRSERGLSESQTPGNPVRFRALRRLLGAPRLAVGDWVRIKSLAEIESTLDASGCLESLPFMPEMRKYCGQTVRVYRSVDKVYDYGGKKDLRRMEGVVLLLGLRCDGAAHGGCQAACYLLWKTAWLEKTSDGADISPAHIATHMHAERVADTPDSMSQTYKCQYTQIVAASRPLRPSSLRQYLRPLVAGNVTLPAFAVAIATSLFNRLQRARGGVGFPWIGKRSDTAPEPELRLRVGELVQVRSGPDIAATLNASNRNKGLWFDRDMLKYAGRQFRVSARVERIIDDATGKMVRMKAPCIILEGVDNSGEFLRFSAQHDYVFWREAWLKRPDAGSDTHQREPGD